MFPAHSGTTNVFQQNLWGPAPAVNPGATRQKQSSKQTDSGATGNASSNNGGSKKRGKKMQKVDSSILGFTCTAAAGRVNIGEIDTAQ